MIIIGIDPGTIVTGYGIIKVEGTHYVPIDFGCIRPPAKLKLSDRYLIIFDGLMDLLKTYQPNVAVVETQYVKKNIQSAIKLGMARGIAILAAKKHQIDVFQYEPTKAKKALVGNGSASKFQVQWMVRQRLNLPAKDIPEDASDALSLAICHAQNCRAINAKKFEI
jgi:crossover junction endodeoxyribonuclease RuvC